MDARKLFEAGIARHREGKLREASELYARVLQQDASHEQASFLSAAIAIESGRTVEGKALLEQLVQRFPQNAVYWTNLGEAHRRLEDNERAAEALTRAVTLKPDLAPAHFNLGLVARKLGEQETALSAFERAADLKPDDPQVQHRLAMALSQAGQDARAVGHFQCAVVLSPSHAELLVDYARCLRNLRRLDVARATANRAAELAPKSWTAQHELSAIASERGRFDDAIAASRRAIELEPGSALAHTGLAAALTDSGKLIEALDAYRKAIALDPSDHLAHGNLVFLEAFRHGSTAQSIGKEARAWSERHAAPFEEHVRAHDNAAHPERRLKVGYVSSNFNEHCQALFTLPVLTEHDRSSFELIGYSATARRDEKTREIAGRFDRFHEVQHLAPPQAADLIRSHGVDVLVDLTMHMATSQLRTFACRPAPVQIAWLAYPGTTGVSAIDYRITDRHLDPEGTPRDVYSEESLVLPDSFWCYAPGANTPPVSELPALTNGFVTFGCLNSFWKLNQPTLELWARALREVPRSRLLLLAPEGSARTWVHRVLNEAGIGSDRIELVSRRLRAQYLKLYDRIDVCLDALPYNGHTTSLDAFWMGVPVVSLVGSTVVGRAGLCQANNLGLPELATHDAGEFVARAAALAGDLEALSTLRAGLRQRLQQSPLMDAPRFVRNLEALYREAWRRWCAARA